MLKNENYTKQLLIGLIITLVLLASFSYMFATEAIRMEESTAEHHKESLGYGRALFVENCTSCHGTRGEGIVGPALNDKILLEEASDGVLFASIQTGRPNTTMPAWGQAYGGALTDEDIHAIVDFIRAFEENAPEVIVGEFTPSASRGASLFSTTCFTCHGENGLGVEDEDGNTILAINDIDSLKKNDNDWYEQIIVNGLPASGMPIWGETLSDNQVQDLLALMDAWRAGENVAPEATVAQMLDSALFSLEQGDGENALFYMNRAKPIAFGPLLTDFESISADIAAGNGDAATMADLRDAWPTGDAEAGEALYKETCAGCHGSEGQGGVGKRMQPNDFITESTNADVFAFTQAGREGTAMQGYKGILTEEQLANIIAFLRTWQE
ncbi:MAG: c-type cytochrome [Anaerolineae bacterium]|jgi:mono/diheme cytochrome c family protein|nr:c-type cytochrome [Anaerolineae bacterium]MBT7076004.1 c-type cytochrome [Anaerolineae bacterium]MBT7782578.1 c-type cytochrome [Anaerolineae bacterium]